MQMVEALKEEKGWAKSTVATMLNRMQKKGLIHYEERGRARKQWHSGKRTAFFNGFTGAA